MNMDTYNSNVSIGLSNVNNKDIYSINATLAALSNHKVQQGLFRGLFAIIVICLPGVIINMKLLQNIKKEQRRDTGKILQSILSGEIITINLVVTQCDLQFFQYRLSGWC